MRSNPHDMPIKLRCQHKPIPIQSCRREAPRVMSGLFGRKVRIGIRGGDLIAFATDTPILHSYLVLRLDGQKFAVPSGDISVERFAELTAAATFTLEVEGGLLASRWSELHAQEIFGIAGNANLLKGRLRLVSEMDNYDLSVWDAMPLVEVDFIMEEEGI